jgi:hypothetical protein
MVFSNKNAKLLTERFPRFYQSASLNEAILLYQRKSEPIGVTAIFSGLSNYVAYELMSENPSISDEEKEIYGYIEEHLKKFSGHDEGSEEFEFANAACVSFLENLINYASSGEIEYTRFIPFLGNESKAFCRSWDAFTGVKSPGLWDNMDEEWHQSQLYWQKIREDTKK